MSQTLLKGLNLHRGAFLWACWFLVLEQVKGVVHGELNFLFGTEDDPNAPLLHLDTLNLVIDESEELSRGVGTPSIALPPGSKPRLDFDRRSRRFDGSFDVMVDFPALRRGDQEREVDPNTDTPGPRALPAKARIQGAVTSDLRPVLFSYETVEAEITIELPPPVEELVHLPQLNLKLRFPFLWLRINTRRQLKLQPIFLSASGSTPPTGEDFYPGLYNANEMWGRCCIEFHAKCPIYIDRQDWRLATQSEAISFKNSTDVSDAIEVFIVGELDPIDLWGGGATFASGTATAKIVSTDNQLPLNQRHLAHELGHVLGLGHPGDSSDGLVDGCAKSVMEPSGFYADNPDLQCESNCFNASNPLLHLMPWRFCISVDRPDDQLF